VETCKKRKGRFGVRFKPAPVGAHAFEQVEGAHDVGVDEIAGAVNGAVHMALGGKIHHGSGLVLCQQAGDQCRIAKITLHKHMATILAKGSQVLQVARVGEFVQVDDGLVGLSQPIEHKVAANKAGAAGHQNRHVGFFLKS
jgi:hypothetical protein